MGVSFILTFIKMKMVLLQVNIVFLFSPTFIA